LLFRATNGMITKEISIETRRVGYGN